MSKNEVRVNTDALREYADQLDALAKRVDLLQQRLVSLSDASGTPLVKAADVLQKGNTKISQCIVYLKDTASDFETVERSIASRL